MYQYDYVRVIGTGVVATKFEEHRALIDRRAGDRKSTRLNSSHQF